MDQHLHLEIFTNKMNRQASLHTLDILSSNGKECSNDQEPELSSTNSNAFFTSATSIATKSTAFEYSDPVGYHDMPVEQNRDVNTHRNIQLNAF